MARLRRLIGRLRSPGDDGAEIGSRVVRSGIWATALNLSDRVLELLTTLVLARLLVPAEFGLIGIALLVLTVLDQFSNLGFSTALIQREEADVDLFMDTTFVVQVVRGAALFALAFLAAPLVASVFGEPGVEPVLQVLALTMLLRGLQNPGVLYFQKRLEFDRQFLFQLSRTGTHTLVTVAAALALGNVWALVYGALAGELVQLAVSYRLVGYRPRLNFDRGMAAQLFGFGKWIFATEVVLFLAVSGDDAFVGWQLSAAALGLYQVAFRISNAPATEITHVISSVMFPAYARLQRDVAALRSMFLRTLDVTFLVTIPMSVGILLVAPAFTRVVLGAAWTGMIPVFQVLAVAGLLRAIQATGGALFRGVGEPAWDFYMNSVRAGVIMATIWPLTDWFGVAGAGLSVVCGIGASLGIWLYKTSQFTALALRSYLRSLAVPAVASAAMGVPVAVVTGPTPLRLAGAVGLGVALYPTVAYGLYRLRGEDPVTWLQSLAAAGK